MSTWILTSTKFAGQVTFQFDDATGLLQRYDITEATLTEEQQVFILKKLPKQIDVMKALLGASKDAKLTQQQATAVTFQMFWDRYNDKGGRSSKKISERRWNRLSQAQRDRAYNYLPTYLRSIPQGVATKYAETYISAELWNN